jgi:gliding motility-associated-like protein
MKDLRNLIPVTALIIIVILWFGFKSVRGVVLPLLTVGMSIIWTIGLISLTGHKLTLVSDIIPVILLALGSAYAIHVLNRINETKAENPRKAYHTPGIYTVKLIARSASGCVDSLIKDSAVYVVGDILVRFPNAFTPNGDGQNDYFKPVIKMVQQAELYIFDRYGNIIFHTNHPESEFWDGTINGKPAPQDVYVWKIIGIFINGQRFIKVGDVTLLR